MPRRSALFICLGNICRSPMAEAVMLKVLRERGEDDEWTIDSAGLIDYHHGKAPYHLTMTVLKRHGVDDFKHKARQLTESDFFEFDYIFGMDHENMVGLSSMAPRGSTAKCLLLGTFDSTAKTPNDVIINDPYYESRVELFDEVYEQCTRSIEGFLREYDQK